MVLKRTNQSSIHDIDKFAKAVRNYRQTDSFGAFNNTTTEKSNGGKVLRIKVKLFTNKSPKNN